MGIGRKLRRQFIAGIIVTMPIGVVPYWAAPSLVWALSY